MEILQLLWTITFFFFTLILIFIWSKVIVVSNKIKAVTDLIEKFSTVNVDELETETVSEVTEEGTESNTDH